MIGRKVEWTHDARPMPGNWPGDDSPDSPCWDMNLVTKKTGTIIATRHSFFFGWMLLVESAGKIVELNLNDCKLLP